MSINFLLNQHILPENNMLTMSEVTALAACNKKTKAVIDQHLLHIMESKIPGGAKGEPLSAMAWKISHLPDLATRSQMREIAKSEGSAIIYRTFRTAEAITRPMSKLFYRLKLEHTSASNGSPRQLLTSLQKIGSWATNLSARDRGHYYISNSLLSAPHTEEKYKQLQAILGSGPISNEMQVYVLMSVIKNRKNQGLPMHGVCSQIAKSIDRENPALGAVFPSKGNLQVSKFLQQL